MTWMTPDEFVAFYGDNLRGALFSAFLALGGFLFSMKTFVLVKMKEGVYDTDQYHDLVMDRRVLNPEYSFYGGLRRFSKLLMWASSSCLVAALCQFTVGLIPTFWASVICILSCVLAVGLLAWSICLSYLNLNDWFEKLEEEAREREDEKKESKANGTPGKADAMGDARTACPLQRSSR